MTLDEADDAAWQLNKTMLEQGLDPRQVARVFMTCAETSLTVAEKASGHMAPPQASQATIDELHRAFDAAGRLLLGKGQAVATVQAAMLAYLASWLCNTATPSKAAETFYAQADRLVGRRPASH